MKKDDDFTLPMAIEDLATGALLSVWWTGVLMKKASRRFFKPLGSSDAHFNLLMAIKYSTTPVTQKDLSRRLLVDKSNITTLVDTLETDGIIKRNQVKGDRRSYHITLTAKGKKLTDNLDGKYQARVQRIMSTLTPGEQKQLVRLTTKLRQGLVAAEEQ